MGRFNDLDLFCQLGTAGKHEYRCVRKEINDYLNERLTFAEMSEKAQTIFKHWEQYCKALRQEVSHVSIHKAESKTT